MKALTFSRFGGPDVLEYRDVPDPVPQNGEVVIRMRAIGVNFADVYRRTGRASVRGTAPFINGYEGAGEIVDANGSELFQAGDRVAFADVPFSNAELVAAPAEHVIPLPNDVTYELAASLLLQGLTAHYLTLDSHRVQPDETVLIHAVAGGVGLLLTQVVKLLGAKVIGVTSSAAKAAVATAKGADTVVLYDRWKDAVMEQTNGRGVDVAYDAVGTTLDDTLAVTRNGGHVVFYGFAGGDPTLVDPRRLMDASQTLTGGDLWHYLTSREERVRRAAELFDWVRSGRVVVDAPTTFALHDGRAAHELLESRASTGKILLMP